MVEGAALGALAGCLLVLLGAGDIVGPTAFQFGALCALPGAAIGLLRRTRALLALDALLGVVVCLVAFLPWTGVMDRWVRADPVPKRPLDAIVVLSGGLTSDSTLFGADRLLAGLELYRAGAAPRIVTTRVWALKAGAKIGSDRDQRRLVELGGATAGWMVVDTIGSTRDEAVGSAELLLPMNARRIIVVTSPSHTHRACAAFEKVGFEVSCRPAVERTLPTWHGSSPDDRLSVFRSLLYELLGMVKYRAMGWV